MSENAKIFDRELGELLMLHRTAKGLTREDLAEKLGLTSAQVERYEAGSNRPSVMRYCTVMSVLNEDPGHVLHQLQERLALADTQPLDRDRSGLDFMASNRGRQLINALAMVEQPEALNALADLVFAIGMRTRAQTHADEECKRVCQKGK